MSLGQSHVDLKPHQVSVVKRVISRHPHRYLLCDEVGLGKTIEAGMILKELRARNEVRRCLVIAPASLLRQWQFELKSKFNETFPVINTETVGHLGSVQGHGGNPFKAFPNAIVSSSWITGTKWAKYATEVVWDMVIIDEAHNARARVRGKKLEETKLYKLVRDLVSPDTFSAQAALFLTATPMQLDSRELYSLIDLLNPALFPNFEDFEQHRSQARALSRLVQALTEHGFPPLGADPSIVVEQAASWLGIDQGVARERLLGGRESVAQMCVDLSAKHLLSEVLIRNRNEVVGGFVHRRAHRWEVYLSEAEQRALEQVETFVRDGFARAARTKDQATGFVMVVLQKQMASSIHALRMSLDRRRERLEQQPQVPSLNKHKLAAIVDAKDRLDQDDLVSALLSEFAVTDAEAGKLRSLVQMLDALATDSKADTLLVQLGELQRHEPTAKVLLFTEFRETQEYLRRRLDGSEWNVYLFHGMMETMAKDRAVAEFRSSTKPSLLLSTEAGGEGRNFQFCHLLVNYDLPWNPIRVEQRIGRVDRIGQTNTVQVFNLCVKDTIEERILDVLDWHINVFRERVGGLEPILSDAEHELIKILQLHTEERDRALLRFGEQVEGKLHAARAAEKEFGDFVMEMKSHSGAIFDATPEPGGEIP
jgi:ATP-dependent helicase HepA